MAIIANTYTQFTAIGLREQLANFISNISPTKTPFISNAGTGEPFKAALSEWQTDSLAAAGANDQLVGDDIAAFSAVTPTVRVGNYAQISRKELILDDRLEELDKAGRRSEEAYQIAKRGAELKRDMEFICLSNVGGRAGNTTTSPRTATLGAWVKTNVDKEATGVNPAWTSGVPSAGRTDGVLRAFTETILKNVMQLGFASGAEFSTLMVGPVNKVRASGFAGIAAQRYNVKGDKPSVIIGAADMYVSDFGTLSIVPNRFQRERDAWFLDFDYVNIGYLRSFRRVKLAKTGDAEKRMLLADWGLRVKNEAALGLAADLTTT